MCGLLNSNLNFAQVSNYSFNSSSGTYTAITGTQLIASGVDDGNSTVLNIGFDFVYDGVTYTQFKMSSNGFISFNTGTSSLTTNDLSTANTTSRPIIAPLWDDLDGRTTGDLSVASYEVTGSAPNRVLTVEWRNWEWNYNSANSVISFQVKLYETTNIIDFVYRQEAAAVNTGSASIGIGSATGSGAGSYLNLTSVTTPAVSSTSSVTNINTKPATNQVYRFTPPSPCTGTPVAGTAAPANQTLLTGQASSVITVSGQSTGVSGLTYQWEESTDGGSNWVNAVGGSGATTLSYSPPTFGGAMIMYRLRITCTASTLSEVSSSAVLNPCGVYSVPTLETLDTFLPTCWQEADNGDLVAGPSVFLSGAWVVDGFANQGTTGAARILIDGIVDNDWILSPLYTIPATGYELRFLAAATQSGGTGAPTTAWESDDFVEVLVSTGTTNWTVLYTFNDTNVPSNIGEPFIVDLDAYAGQTVRFAYRAVEGALNGAAAIDFSIDDFEIRETPACIDPNNLTASNLTSTSVDVEWNDPSGTQFDYEYVLQAPGIGMPTGSGLTWGDTMIQFTSLSPATSYEFWVRADCGGSGYSMWVGPLTFTTECSLVTDFVQTFDGVTSPAFPVCWSKISGTGTANTQTATPNSAPNTLYVYSSSSTNLAVVAMQPVSNLGAGTHRLRFNMRANFTVGGIIEFGYLTNPLDATSFVTISTVTAATLTYQQYLITPPAGSYSNYPAFRHTGVPANSLLIDDVVWEALPLTPPSCATNIVATPHATCGNSANTITWDATANADGYTINVGTTPGGTNIANAVNLNTPTYSFTGTANTTYYFTVLPYNINGPATGCSELSFITNANACYCIPTYNNGGTGDNITNVTIGSWSNASTGNVSPYYEDFTTQQPTPIAIPTMMAGLNSTVAVTMGTDGTQYSRVWIDFNQNTEFEASESFSLATSAGASGTSNIVVSVPAGAIVGVTTMRIRGGDDSAILATQACGASSSVWGQTEDYLVEILPAPACTMPTVTFSAPNNCPSSSFNAIASITNMGSATSLTITDNQGSPAQNVTAIGDVTFGPYALGTNVVLTVTNDQDGVCSVSSSNLTFAACPPANDECANATVLTPGAVFATNPLVATNVAATGSTGVPAPGCASYSGGDVWYQVTVPASGSLTVETNNNGGGITDTGLAVYSGTCGSLALVECDDDDSSDGLFSLVALTGRTPGEVLYVRVWEYGNNAFGTFQVSAYDASLSSGSFDNASFTAYPNPVKDILNVSYTSEISSLRVINMIGQEVISKNINATSAQVDMSQLSAGTYIVNVTIGDAVKTLKVVKQ